MHQEKITMYEEQNKESRPNSSLPVQIHYENRGSCKIDAYGKVEIALVNGFNILGTRKCLTVDPNQRESGKLNVCECIKIGFTGDRIDTNSIDIEKFGKKDQDIICIGSGDGQSLASFWKRYIYQIQLIAIMGFLYLTTSALYIFPSVLAIDMIEHNTTIYGESISFSDAQMDAMGSCISIGCLIGMSITGITMLIFGRKPLLGFMAFLGLVSGVGIALSPDPNLCLLFRIIGGMSVGGVAVARTSYITEITDDVSRPIFSQFGGGLSTLGQVLSLIPAFWMRYYGVALFNSIFPAIFLVAVVFVMPESPTFLALKGRNDEAVRVVTKLHGKNKDVKEILEEYRDANEAAQEVNTFKAIANKTVLKKLGVMFIIFSLYAFSGVQIFVAQCVRVLVDSGSYLDAAASAIICQVSLMFGVWCLIPFINKLGRKGSLMTSCTVAAFGMIFLGTYSLFYDKMQNERLDALYDLLNSLNVSNSSTESQEIQPSEITIQDLLIQSVHWVRETAIGDEGISLPSVESDYFVARNGWIPLACVVVSEFGFGMGMYNIPFYLSAEYFPTVIRPQTTSISMMFSQVMGFVSFQLYSPMQGVLTMAGLLYFYSCICLVTVFYVYFVVEETTGKSLG